MERDSPEMYELRDRLVAKFPIDTRSEAHQKSSETYEMPHLYHSCVRSNGSICYCDSRSTLVKVRELIKIEERDGVRLLSSLIRVLTQKGGKHDLSSLIGEASQPASDFQEELVDCFLIGLHRSDRLLPHRWQPKNRKEYVSLASVARTIAYLRQSRILKTSAAQDESLRSDLLDTFEFHGYQYYIMILLIPFCAGSTDEFDALLEECILELHRSGALYDAKFCPWTLRNSIDVARVLPFEKTR